ncbi:hypothetical protein B0T24DRAFT_500359, partial [Lasiosphaeria ovina]
MAEAAAAFALAASIVQFLDFGAKLASKAWRIHQNGQDGVDELLDIHDTTKDLTEILTQLRVPDSLDTQASTDHSGLLSLANSCQAVAEELIELLGTVKLPHRWQPGRRAALKAALKIVLKEGEIRSLHERIDYFRQQLTLHLLSLIKQSSSEPGRNQAGSLILEKMFLGGSIVSSARLDTKVLRNSLVSEIFKTTDNATFSHIASPVTVTVTPDQQADFLQAILRQLDYATMDDRDGRILEPDQETFEWIFRDPAEYPSRVAGHRQWSHFGEWLRSDSQLYWITGKAGSGKSTLMKYIACPEMDEADPKDPELRDWAAGHKLVVSSFFFWNSGELIQKTFEGLFRTLLFQILEQCPEIVPYIMPPRWESFCLFGGCDEKWSDGELRAALQLAVSHDPDSFRYCLFIDGLDEFEGDHKYLTSFLKSLLASPNVKICASSRPWIVFEDEFALKPHLKLEHITYDDIKRCVTSRLESDPGYLKLELREPEYAVALIGDIITRSSGVFLWVNIVVSNLIKGFTEGDRVSDIQRRLESLPLDLEQLYDKILQGIDPFYMEHTAQLFLLRNACPTPPDLLLFSFADEPGTTEEGCRDLEGGALLSSQVKTAKEEAMRRRINSRCLGLLEVSGPFIDSISGQSSPYECYRVEYLHRTVREFLQKPSIKTRLATVLKEPFDPHLRLCAAYLSYARRVSPSLQGEARLRHLSSEVRLCLYHAS